MSHDEPMRPRVLAIDDSDLVHRLLRARLRHERIDLHSVLTADEGIAAAKDLQPEVILLDIDLEDLDGFEVLARLKADPITRDIAVIFVSASNETMDRVRGLDLGAVDFVGKPFDVGELKARVRSALRMQRLVKMLAQRAQLDGLTGLWNRAYLDDRLEAETASAIRYGNPLSVVLCDLDRFKSLNDSYGHPFGDEVLERAASILGSGRSPDVACRYGGEEFALIAPGTDLKETMEVADRHRVRIAEIEWPDRPGVRISASFGVADLTCVSGTPTPEKLIAAADQALYEAKKAGRDQVVAANRQVWPRAAG
ncbi:diguanylate cyclase [Phycisphaerales bacterium]|nr:diguanylate cyclase [bacterium]MDC0429363.1 diguanylate cyclase [Phycisphaerales bacterium]RPG14726.1 MAG: diguanylate cyclase [Phycisphaera sp. TMED9]